MARIAPLPPAVVTPRPSPTRLEASMGTPGDTVPPADVLYNKVNEDDARRRLVDKINALRDELVNAGVLKA